jgi:hypothetical protein
MPRPSVPSAHGTRRAVAQRNRRVLLHTVATCLQATQAAAIHYLTQRNALVTQLLSYAFDSSGRLRQTARLTRTHFWPDIKLRGDAAFKRHFRMSIRSFEKLVDLLREDLPGDQPRAHRRGKPALSTDWRVAICLYRFASGADVRIIGQLFGSRIPRSHGRPRWSCAPSYNPVERS